MSKPKPIKQGSAVNASFAKYENLIVDPREMASQFGYWSTGSPAIDRLLGGGLTKGRISEFYGREQCIDAESHVAYNVRDAETGKTRNTKGGTIANLYARFHGLPRAGKGAYARATEGRNVFTAPSVNAEGRIIQNRILDVVKSGVKECFEIVTRQGYTLVATAEHKFWTGTQFLPLGDLEVGDTVMLHNNTPYAVADAAQGRNLNSRVDVYVKHHPVAGVKVVEGTYTYYRLRRSRAVVEARMNGLSYDAYIARLDAGDIAGLAFLSREQHVHHLDENILNDAPENLTVLTERAHKQHHARQGHNNLRFAAMADTVRSITAIGPRETYDLRMESPYNNYVANGLVVHNSGKSTLALSVARGVIATGGRVLYIDLERGLEIRDPGTRGWLEVNGINAFDGSFEVVQAQKEPIAGEDLYNLMIGSVRDRRHQYIVLDSMAAVVTRAELAGEIGDATFGAVAKLNSAALKVLFQLQGTNPDTHITIINQVRDQLQGTMGGLKSTGGRALPHYTHQRLRLDKMERAQEQKDGDFLTEVKVRSEKARGMPVSEVRITISANYGIDVVSEVVNAAVAAGYIHKAGAWYALFDRPVATSDYAKAKTPQAIPGFVFRSQGDAALRQFLRETPRLYAPLYDVAIGLTPVDTVVDGDGVPVLAEALDLDARVLEV